ncbi:unnamed protein product [Cladocopium goreaui]|uniref:Uncharacterized protein n=1 Tax=Cladocopium goreaui TaxID=2562237 RepID=A0A9P1CED2_9DINO|nr:unnamed protein product [Cladocopium goreaui]
MEKVAEEAIGASRVPELHGGPEGQYLRESTGRWRSLSQEPASQVQRPVPPLGEHGAVTLASSVAVDPEMMAKQKAARQVRQDTSKLWEAARRRLDSKTFEDLKRQDDLERAEAEVAFEKARQQGVWQLLRGAAGADRQLLAEIARLASGGEGRCLSVEKARQLFDGSSAASAVSAGTAATPARRRSFSRGEEKKQSRKPPRPTAPAAPAAPAPAPRIHNESSAALGGA